MPVELVGVVSLYSLIQHEVATAESAQAMLKRAAILCDRIFFDTAGLGPPGPMQDNLMLRAFGGHEAETLRSSREFKRLLVRPEDLGNPEDILSTIHGWLAEGSHSVYSAAVDFVEALPDDDGALVAIAAPWRGVDYKARGELALTLTTDIRRPECCARWFDRPVGLLTPLHHRLLTHLADSAPTDGLGTLRSLEEKSVVDLGGLAWENVLRLRTSGFIDDFRARLWEIAEAGRDVYGELWADLWRYVGERLPNPTKTAIGGILGSLPVIGSVVGPALAVAETLNEADQLHRFGWLFFVLEAHPAG